MICTKNWSQEKNKSFEVIDYCILKLGSELLTIIITSMLAYIFCAYCTVFQLDFKMWHICDFLIYSICTFKQKLVLLYPQSVTFTIVSRCFENKNNDCCETKIPFVYEKIVLKSISGHTATRVTRLGIYLPFLFHNNYCFFFIFQISGYNGNVTDCGYSKTNFCF